VSGLLLLLAGLLVLPALLPATLLAALVLLILILISHVSLLGLFRSKGQPAANTGVPP
jgi:hypothetical protein